MKGPEQRQWLRVVVNMRGRCRVIDGPPRYESTLIVDMHHHGCCIFGPTAFEEGQTVRLIVELPFEGQISMTGQVVWAGPANDDGDCRTGVSFLIDGLAAEEACNKLYNYCLLRQPKK